MKAVKISYPGPGDTARAWPSDMSPPTLHLRWWRPWTREISMVGGDASIGGGGVSTDSGD